MSFYISKVSNIKKHTKSNFQCLFIDFILFTTVSYIKINFEQR